MKTRAPQPAASKPRGTLPSIVCNLASGVLISVLASPAFAAPQTAGALTANARFHGYLGTTITNPARRPFAAAGNEQVLVVVRMASAPTAVVRAQRVDHSITESEHAAIHQKLNQEHMAVVPAIEARGGHVMNHFSDAINGIKVRINRSEIEGLKTLPGVVEVMPVGNFHLTNTESVPFIGAPAVWQGTPSFRGEGIKVAIIDTGIDYTHANFGGPGTVAAFTAAAAKSALPADPALFGPNAPKVKGGTDLSGDAYDGSAAHAPQPDANPLDCNGHGSHTAGTAAGFGVGADGKTYRGLYNSAAYAQAFVIGPGVAPKADLYAVRVFGCTGSTNLVVDAIDWSIANDMDVISMSLGSDYGTVDTADALAVKNATQAGILVAAASGNAGPAPYITSTPASGPDGISVAAIDSHASFPGALVTLAGGGTIEMQDSNGAPLTGALGIVVLRTAAGGISLGCNEAEYVDSVIAGKLVVAKRGSCARALRAQLGQKHGAAAVALINTSAGYPPYEGQIAGVTIPFLGVLGSDQVALSAATSTTAFAANTIANPTFRSAASFSSGGPRFGDSSIRPNVSAPGVSVFSTASGTGNGGVYESGTSMATPHVAGVAALTRQAHPHWSERALRAAVVDTADPGKLTDYAPRIEGAGLVQPVGATATQAVVFGDEQNGTDDPKGFAFGFEESARTYHATRQVSVHNYGNSEVSFNITTTAVGGSPHTATLSDSSVSVDGHESEDLDLTLTVPAATVGSTHDAFGNTAFQEVAGYVTFTPADPAMNNGVSLHVPYYLVPRARSNVSARLRDRLNPSNPNQHLVLRNKGGGITGNADFYAWGLTGPSAGLKFFDTRAVGVQSFPISTTDNALVFAVNTYTRFSSSDVGEFDILIDVNGDGKPDYDLFSADLGGLTTGSLNGVQVTALLNLHTNALRLEYPLDSPTDGSTALLVVNASDLGITPTNPRFTYSEATFNLLDGTSSALPGTASFNAFSSSISNALYVPVAPNTNSSVAVAIDPVEWLKTPALGLMVVVEDNFSGNPQARLIPTK